MQTSKRPNDETSQPLDTIAALKSLRSTECPACGDTKRARQSLCRTCYYRLPQAQRSRLFKRFPAYLGEINDALQTLEDAT